MAIVPPAQHLDRFAPAGDIGASTGDHALAILSIEYAGAITVLASMVRQGNRQAITDAAAVIAALAKDATDQELADAVCALLDLD